MDEQIYGVLKNSATIQEGWKHRKSEFRKDKKLAKEAEKLIKDFDVVDEIALKALKKDKQADKEYDRDKEKG